MPAVNETEENIALARTRSKKNYMVGEEKRKVTNNHLLVTFFSYPRSESNRDRQNRNLKFYPLNYRGIRLRDCKFNNFN